MMIQVSVLESISYSYVAPLLIKYATSAEYSSELTLYVLYGILHITYVTYTIISLSKDIPHSSSLEARSTVYI